MTLPTFILVHGAWHGGWCWHRVSPRLTNAGFGVLAPTCAGLGDRDHLLSPAVGLATFIEDVCAAIAGAGPSEIILVGHSLAGVVISGVVDRMPERIGHLVYLDANLTASGSIFDAMPPEVAAARRAAARASPGGLTIPVPAAEAFGVTDPRDVAWLAAHARPQPIRIYDDKLELAHPLGNGRPKTYVACTAPAYPLMLPFHVQARTEPGWSYRELATGHDAMVSAPDLLAATLLDVADPERRRRRGLA